MCRSPSTVFVLILLSLGFLAGCSSKQTVEDFIASADALYTNRQLEEAEIQYLNVLQTEGRNPHAISQLGLLYFEQGRPLDAVRFLVTAKDLAPENADVRTTLGMALLAIGDRVRAREELEAALAMEPNNEKALLALAETPVDEESTDAVRQILEAAAEIPATRAPALVGLSALAVRKQELDQATELTEQALAADSNSASAHFAKGFLLLARKEIEPALASFSKAADLSPLRSPKRLRYAQLLNQQGQHDAADALLSEITTTAPGYLPAWLLKAEFDVQKGRMVEAKANLDRILQQADLFPEALLVKAKIHVSQGEAVEAEKLLRRAIEAYPSSADYRYQLGLSLLEQKKLDDAKAAFSAALSIQPGRPDVVMVLAAVEIRTGNPDRAVTLLSALLKANPGLTSAWPMLAEAHRLRGEVDEALAIFVKMEESFGPIAETAFARGNIQAQKGNRDAAKAAYEEALKLNPDHPGALDRLVNLLISQQEVGHAQELVDSRLKEKPDSPSLLLLQAQILFASKDQAGAKAALERTIELNPEAARPYFMLAGLSFQNKEFDEAIGRLEQTIERSPQDLRALMMLGLLYDQNGMTEKAGETYERILTVAPNSVVALNNLAYIQSKRNDLDGALATARRARELQPNDPNIADTLGWIAHRRGDQRWAASLLKEAAAGFATSGEIQYHLGVVQYEIGAEPEANLALQKALELDPAAAYAADAKERLALLNEPLGSNAALIDKRLSAEPSDPIALLRKITRQEQDGNVAAALKATQTGATKNPANVPLQLKLASLALARDDLQTAREASDAAYKLEPDNVLAIAQLAVVSAKQQEHARAFGLWTQAATSDPSNREYKIERAIAAYNIGQLDRFAQILDEVVNVPVTDQVKERGLRLQELANMANSSTITAAQLDQVTKDLATNPRNAPALYAAAKGYELQQKNAQAAASYQKLLQFFPDFQLAKRDLVMLRVNSGETDEKTLELALSARTFFPNDAPLAQATGILYFRQENFDRATFTLREAATLGSDSAVTNAYLGLSMIETGAVEEGSTLLKSALQNNLPPELRNTVQTRLGALTEATKG